MKVIRMAVICRVLVFSIFWSFGCSQIQPVTPKDKMPPEVQTEQLSPPEAPPEVPPEQLSPPEAPIVTYYTHIIKWKGENLMRISRWYTGSVNNWLRIVEANPSIDPKRIQIGDSVLIPESLLKTREPMPISYRVPVVRRKKKEAPEPSTKSLPNTGEVELFGPIDIETQPNRLEGAVSSPPLQTIE